MMKIIQLRFLKFWFVFLSSAVPVNPSTYAKYAHAPKMGVSFHHRVFIQSFFEM